MPSPQVTFKMILIGEGSVGKTAIRERYLGKAFKGKYNMTIGADFALKRMQVDGTNYVMQIWDLAGQSGFMRTRSLYYQGAMAGLLVFDINRPKTFDRLDFWINEVKDNRGHLIPIVLIGNKVDLRGETENQVTTEQGERFAEVLSEKSGYNIPYIETSALTGENVEDAFMILVRNVSKIIEENQNQ